MSDLSGLTTNFLTTASETFVDNLSSSIAALDATVPVTNATEYTNGDIAVLTVEPGTDNEATFVGRKNGNQFEDCVWTEGNLAVGHANGVTIIDYDSATHHNAIIKALLKIMNQDGTLLTQPIRDALGLGATAANGWEVSPYTYQMSTGQTKGNREFDLTVANADLTGVYSAGQRLRFTRGTTPATQCAGLASASSQYFSRASASIAGNIGTFTDDWTTEAWINPTTMTASMGIVSRYNGTSGWIFYINSNGQIVLQGLNAGASNYRRVTSYQSVLIGEWNHVAATMDMSGHTTATCIIWLNGISVPAFTETSGTGPTALVQAGNLEVGSFNGGSTFNGEISGVRVWNTARTTTQIQDNMHQALTGAESNLIGYWILANSLLDSTSNANTLTANGGAATTTVDNPFGATEYAIITKVAYSAPNSTVTVITPTNGSIPNQTLTAPYYSAQRSPYGFPANRNRWTIRALFLVQAAVGANTTFGSYNSGGDKITVPTGAWQFGADLPLYSSSTNNVEFCLSETDITGTAFGAIPNTEKVYRVQSTSAANLFTNASRRYPLKVTSPTTFTLYQAASASASGSAGLDSDNQLHQFIAESTYV